MRRAGLLMTVFVLGLFFTAKAQAGLVGAFLTVANNYAQTAAGVTSTTGFYADPIVIMQSAGDFNGGTITYSGLGSPSPAYIPMTLAPSPNFPTELVATSSIPFGFSTLAILMRSSRSAPTR